jgi:subtilase family serine protease
MQRLLTVVLGAACACCLAPIHQALAANQAAVTDPIDDNTRVTLAGNTRPEASAANDLGKLAPTLMLDHMQLQLKRLPADERMVEAYVNSMTTKGSPVFHKWLTAVEFGRRFGAADVDLAKVTGWLKGHGLTVNFVYPSRMVIDFSGPVGAVDAAFHTEMHRLSVKGAPHIANMHDPEIPAALANVVEGIVSLHDFRAHGETVHRPRDTGGSCNLGTCYVVAPGDLATIYDITALYQNGIAGQGEVIAAVEPTNLYSNNDFTNFRTTFQLNRYTAGRLVVQHPAPVGGAACGNPGVDNGPDGSDGEAALDVEWATAVAPAATILLASCASTDVSDGVYIATQNLTNGSAPPPVISVSYGICEANNGAAQNAAFNKLYQQAAAQGISVFVATGDNGPTDCASSSNGTRFGIGVNGWGATQYNVAVGGTDFGDEYSNTTTKYWNNKQGAPWTTALSYIPEITWNDTCASLLVAQYFGGTTTTYGASGFCNSSTGAQFLSLGGGEGGPSGFYSGTASVANVVSGTCKGYPKPSWQKLLGVPADGVRDVPDVSMFASDGSVWGHSLATCFTDPTAKSSGPCTGNPATWAANAGGTSYATPIMAAIQALVDQDQGGAQGNPAPVYYQLAAAEYGTAGSTACASTKGAAIGTTCIFRDVVTGDDDVDCLGTYNCYRPSGTYGVLSTSDTAYKPAYKTAVGYDFPTGIGSVDAFNLVSGWP